MQFEEFDDCLAWYSARNDGPRAWRVPAEGLIDTDGDGRVVAVNLDIKNPSVQETEDHRLPLDILNGIVAQEQKILALLREIESLVGV